MDEVDTRAQREYEHKLEEALFDFRKQHDVDMKRYRVLLDFRDQFCDDVVDLKI